MLAGLGQKIDLAKILLKHHSPTILTGVGVAGTVVTSYLTGRATFKAASLIEGEKLEFEAHEDPENSGTFVGRAIQKELSKTEKVKLVWRLYIPPVATGLLTVTSIVTANKISSTRIAVLTAAAGVSERALQEYKEKVMDRLTERQNEKIRDDIAQERVSGNLESKEVVLVGQGQVLCYDLTTDRYFQSTIEDIKRAENKINSELLNHMAASLAEFHDELGLRATNYTDSVGWDSPEMFKVIFSSVLSPDGRPCVAIDFERPPVLEYARRY
jgi:Family of unknown function (DUF6353)